ncbi:helix-turn-helix transcriptional regulator [Phytohalomonas tamaricis]|uniref:helix-turn-helix transcriptional regulator n=1 Tax=Phytohalomonas tamaricis TaxID=2081032 RepID=UPI0021D4859E|nr:helix-turn-helix transcriptional regulator [Phytohalomonas tamaricis]
MKTEVPFNLIPSLTQTIEALRSTCFTRRLVTLMRALLESDCVVIIGHRPGRHPIYLFDSIVRQRELLFQYYLMQAWQRDPFLLSLDSEGQEGVFRFADVQASASREYVDSFYHHTGWRGELCLSIRLDDKRWVVLYLGVIDDERHFTREDFRCLIKYFDLLRVLCLQHWERAPFHLASMPQSHDGVPGNMSRQLNWVFTTFRAELLTPREQQVVALMVQGLAPDEVAECLGITVGIARNHRKHIYARFGIGSTGELFRLFLNHVITLAPREEKT